MQRRNAEEERPVAGRGRPRSAGFWFAEEALLFGAVKGNGQLDNAVTFNVKVYIVLLGREVLDDRVRVPRPYIWVNVGADDMSLAKRRNKLVSVSNLQIRSSFLRVMDLQ